MNSKIANILNFVNLKRLIKREIIAIQVENFYPEDLCRKVGSKIKSNILAKLSDEGKIYDSNVIPFFNTHQNTSVRDKYFSSSLEWLEMCRFLASPYLSPIDLLRLKLDELWISGANLMRINNEVMNFGIARTWKVGSEALPHQDILRREVTNDTKISSQQSQLGVNIYMSTADVGGELEIWDYSISDEYWKELDINGSYGFPKNILPDDSILMTPKTGDLILINSTNVHSVKKIQKGERTTMSGFVGYWGESKPLRLWS